MWIVNAVLVHLLLFGAIFVIYFRSPVIRGLTPQNALHLEGPARRLVLFVTDGLRAESFFRDRCVDVPHLRTLFHKGLVGVSHTRVPTESRPGHIALIAGMYEDPSAVMRGWKENPIDFDTVFNRSSQTFAWGANDVLHIFSRLEGSNHSRLYVDVYDHDLDFSGRDKTHALDDWVFERAALLLQRKGASLNDSSHVMFFLHLLGLDTAGHVHKPGSPLFLENLHRTETGIFDMYKSFEAAFPDGRTAYVLTADHGMTNGGERTLPFIESLVTMHVPIFHEGSHGSGGVLETETPFFIWGAGISSSATVPDSANTFQMDNDSGTITMTRHAMEQAQMAPLMSALLGQPPPMNNFGTLPTDFLNAPSEYKAQAAHSNALQLLEQFRMLLSQHERGLFTALLKSYGNLTRAGIAQYVRRAEHNRAAGEYEAAIGDAQSMMRHALEGIDFYHGYYRNALLVATTLTYCGWIYYLLRLLSRRSPPAAAWLPRHRSLLCCNLTLRPIVLASCGCVVAVLQRIPLIVAVYLLLPIFVWQLALAENRQRMPFTKGNANKWMVVEYCFLGACTELLVCAFFDRRLISLAFLLYAAATSRQLVSGSGSSVSADRNRRTYIWLLFGCGLVLVPLLITNSGLGASNAWLQLLGMVAVCLRPLYDKAALPGTALIATAVALANGVICVYQHSHQIGISPASQIVSWSFLAYVSASICCRPTRPNGAERGTKHRVALIEFLLTALYSLFCLSGEALFVLLLCSELKIAMPFRLPQLEQQLGHGQLSSLHAPPATAASIMGSLRLAFTILIYTLFSFFGTGNIASISSFDPNVIRCFITTFSPFLIMLLVIVKLIIPIALVLAIVFGLNEFTRRYERQVFIGLLLICDLMGLNFLFLVRNRGSWLEIGTSISHFVIMQATTVVLVLLAQAIKLCLQSRGAGR